MAVREMIIAGSVGLPNPESFITPFLRHLHGKFVDELTEGEKLLYEYTQVESMGDFWLAYWDDQKKELWPMPNARLDQPMPTLRVAYDPPKGVKSLLPALYQLCEILEIG